MKTRFLTELFDIISPRSCAICGCRLAASESVLCAPCHLALPLTGFSQKPYDNPMTRLFWAQIPIEKASAYFFFLPQSETSQMIYHLKYHHCPEIGEHLGRMMARDLLQSRFFDGIDAIVPMPITRWRQWRRGYNQSEEIAIGIREATSLPILSNVIKRVRFSESQTRKRNWERLENVNEAFRLLCPKQVRGRHLLIVDDIVTTGATVRACAKELCKAGDVRISVLSLGFTKS